MNINYPTAEQRSLKQKQSGMLFTLVDGFPTNIWMACHFGEFGNGFQCIQCSTLPRDERKDLDTLQHHKKDPAYAEKCFLYALSNLKNSPHLFEYIITASIYVWDGRKLVPEDGEASPQSGKSYSNVDVERPDPAGSEVAGQNNMHFAEMEITVLCSIEEEIIYASEPM